MLDCSTPFSIGYETDFRLTLLFIACGFAVIFEEERDSISFKIQGCEKTTWFNLRLLESSTVLICPASRIKL